MVLTHVWSTCLREWPSITGLVSRSAENNTTFPPNGLQHRVRSCIVLSTASMQRRGHISISSKLINSSCLRTVASWLSAGTLQESDSLYRIAILEVEWAVISLPKSWTTAAKVAKATNIFCRSSRKPWMAFGREVSPVPTAASKRSRRKRYEEWRWIG